MKAHTSEFKNQIKTMGRELDSKITYTLNGVNVELGGEQLNSIIPTYQGALLKSVMKELDIDSNVYIPEKTILNYEFGVKVNGEYEYINFGNYIVYKAEKQEDTNSYKLTCYDKMLYSMIDYEKMDINYPISIRNYIKAICNKLGLTFKNANSTFANYNRKINNELYLDASGNSLDYTFRDVLDELSQVTASCICINENDELEIRYINDTNDTIDEEFLKDININFGEKFGAVNTIVLSRSADSDNIYYPETLPENPFKFKISDNQIMNWNDRADYLPDIYSKLNGLEFYINDFSSTGVCYYELLDRYNVKIGDNTYSCIMLNDEINITQGLEENIYTELPEQTETDYKKADTTDRKINQAYVILDKQNKKFEVLVSSVESIDKQIIPTATATGSNIHIEDASDKKMVNFEIEGKSIQATRSGKNLFNKNSTPLINGASITVLDTGVRATLTTSGNYRYFSIKLGGSELLGKTLTYGATITSSSNNQPRIALYFGNSTSSAKILINAKGTSGPRTITIPDEFPDDCDTIWIIFYANLTGTGNIGDYVDYTNLMVVEGNTLGNYEDYGVMPSPDYPSEIESVGYENLFNKLMSNYTSFSNTITIDSVSDNSITLTISSTGGPYDTVRYYSVANLVVGKTYTVSANIVGNDNSLIRLVKNNSGVGSDILGYVRNNNSFTFTYDGSYNSLGLFLYISHGVQPTEDLTATFSNIQIEEGSQSHSYIPYGKYGIEVKNTGKNLLNIFENYTLGQSITNNGIIYTVNEDGTITANGTATANSGLDIYSSKSRKSIKKGTYTLSGSTGGTSSTYRIILGIDKEYFSINGGTTFTINEDTSYYMTIRIYKGQTVNNLVFKPMIEKGTVATNYEPYQSNTSLFVLDQPLRSLPNGVKDIAYIKNNILYVDRKVGSIILNGSERWNYVNGYMYISKSSLSLPQKTYGVGISSHFKYAYSGNEIGTFRLGNAYAFLLYTEYTDASDFKTWLSTHNTQVDYELAKPYTEKIGEVEIPSTFKGVNNITITDELEPVMNIEYVRDTILSNYVEGQVSNAVAIQERKNAEFQITNEEIKSSVSNISTDLDGTKSSLNSVEEKITSQEKTINIISKNIDGSTGDIREVTTTTGFTFNAEGLTIDDGAGYKAQHRAEGTYYKDGTSVVGQYTKDGSKQKDLQLFGIYSYGMKDIDDTPMFIGQLYEDENGEECFGHFYNGGDY